MNERKPYSSDVTNEERSHLRILLPQVRGSGRRRTPHQQRELLNAIFYQVQTGCQWRNLPHDFPAWQTVYAYFRALSDSSVWERINTVLRRGVRQQAGRDPEPSVIIVDSQSTKTTEKRGSAGAMTVESASKDANAISRWT
jgi:putative transposase